MRGSADTQCGEREESVGVESAVGLGVGADGIVHLMIAFLAIQLALGGGGGSASQKGALAELARLTEIPRETIFACGDHHNDLSMLDGRYAALPACPANAIPEVKEAVRRADGWVAEKEAGAGVHEARRHFLT